MDAVGEVKSRLSVEDVVSEYVQLKRAGRNFKGLSPFTNEKTPSFVVSPEKQIWHDFSSGRGGDMFTFVQEIEGLDFKGALELLARKAGVDLDKYENRSSSIDKQRLFQILELAAKFYQSQLSGKPEAAEYLIKKRGFNKHTLLEFQLGYSPDNKSSLADFLIKKGYTKKELQLCGLISGRGDNTDMFRGRIMIPLHDSVGKVVGFTARLLKDDKNSPKYINTPSTPLYDKSRHVYGLHLAKKSIREEKYSIIVEGNLDVISSHQAGVKHVVATAGTAITEQQLKALTRFSGDVRLAFDQDRAGLEAAERAIPIASKVGANLSIITVPEGKDPDELIKKDVNLWTQAIANADYAVDWLIERYKEKTDVSSAKGKREFSDIMTKVIRSLDDPVEQDHYVQVVSEISGVDPSALRRKLENSSNDKIIRYKKSKTEFRPEINQNRVNATNKLLSLCLMLPGTRGYLDLIEPQMLANENQVELLSFLRENPDFDGDVAHADKLKKIAEYAKILILQFEELYASIDTLELQYEAQRLRARIIEYYIHDQKLKLSGELQTSRDSDQTNILEEVHKLDKLLKQIKLA